MNKTAISAGLAIYDILKDAPDVAGRVTDIYPGIADNVSLPYIAYQRLGLDASHVKAGASADTARVCVIVFSQTYTEGVEIAEAVRDALDGVSGEAGGLRVRGIALEDASEGPIMEANCFEQTLVFSVKIG